MNEQEYRGLLELGLGRAIIYARNHDMRAFRGVILDACLHCYALDVQSEGTRGSYMHDLVGVLPDKAYYHDAVIESLRESGDDWDAAQRFHFVACLAFDGDERAKRAIYRDYAPGTDLGDHIGIDFLKLDGVAGLLFVADKIGSGVDSAYLLSESFEICGEQNT